MKRWYRVLALLLASVILLAACGEVPQAQVEDEPETGVQTVKIFTYGFDPGLDDVISAYYALYPNVRVERVTPPRDGPSQSPDDLIPAKIGERAVDIVPAYVDHKLLMPLDPYILKYGFDLKPIEELLPGLKWDGKLYELPYQVYFDTLLYNPDYFAKQHVEVPKEPMTWDQFRELAAKLTRDGGYGFYDMVPENLVWTYMAQRRALDGNTGGYTVAELTETLQFLSTLVLTDKSMPPVPQRDWTRQPMMLGNTRDYFNLGQAAMSMESLSFVRMSYYKFKVGVLPAPQLKTDQGGIRVSPQSYAIAANSRHPDAAFQFLAFLTGPQGQAAYARAGVLPAYRTPDVKQAYLSQEQAPPMGAAAMLDAAWFVTPRPASAPKEDTQPEKPDPRANPYVPANEVLSGQKSVADAVRDWAVAAKAK